MAETVHDRITRYLTEAHASEHHLEKVLRRFADSSAGDLAATLTLLVQKNVSHQSSLESTLQARGSSVSKLRTGLAEGLALAPLHARMGDTAPERVSQRRTFAIAATAHQAGTYAALATVASVGRQGDAAALAQRLLCEEQEDLASLQKVKAASPAAFKEHPAELVVAYLEDIIAAEHSFESQLKAFISRAAQQPEAQAACNLFTEHAKTTREDFEQLTRRLESLGGEPSILKGFFAEVFNSASRFTGVGHDANEQLTQDLVMLFAIANAEVALLAELEQIAKAASDDTTATLAVAIAETKQGMIGRAWREIEAAALVSIGTMPYFTSS